MRRGLQLDFEERDELAEARAASDSKSLSERADETIAWVCVNLAEIARTSRDRDDLQRRLEGELPTPLRVIWDSRERA